MPADSPEVRDLTARLLPIFALSLPGDGANATLQGLLRGSGRQETGAVTNLCSYWLLGIPAAAYFAFRQAGRARAQLFACLWTRRHQAGQAALQGGPCVCASGGRRLRRRLPYPMFVSTVLLTVVLTTRVLVHPPRLQAAPGRCGPVVGTGAGQHGAGDGRGLAASRAAKQGRHMHRLCCRLQRWAQHQLLLLAAPKPALDSNVSAPCRAP